MRSYGQHCGLARTLDVVGDRWTLLIVRELMIRDCRFSELRRGLPGIASNLLADRLRELETGALVETVDAGGVTRYRLTERGRELAPVLRELAHWGAPLMYAGPGDDLEQGHWLVIGADSLLEGPAFRSSRPLLLQFHADGESVWLRLRRGAPIETGLGVRDGADVTITGTLHQCLAVLAGLPDNVGVQIAGALERLGELPRFGVSRADSASRAR